MTMPTDKAQIGYGGGDLQVFDRLVGNTQVKSNTHSCWFDKVGDHLLVCRTFFLQQTHWVELVETIDIGWQLAPIQWCSGINIALCS